MPNRFNVRAFVSLMIAFTGLGLPVTGVLNHLYAFSPPSVGQHSWMAAHNALGLLFVSFAVWHITINRRALWKHIRGVGARARRVNREALIAGAVVALVLLVSVGHAFHAGG